MGVPSYGLAIIMFTILLKIVLFPLTVTQMRSMRAMQELQPKIKAIQDRYKDKPEKSQEAVMKLYKEAGANPFAGCLPLLVQMPILFALFSALRTFFNQKIANAGFLWIQNLGYADSPHDKKFGYRSLFPQWILYPAGSDGGSHLRAAVRDQLVYLREDRSQPKDHALHHAIVHRVPGQHVSGRTGSLLGSFQRCRHH